MRWRVVAFAVVLLLALAALLLLRSAPSSQATAAPGPSAPGPSTATPGAVPPPPALPIRLVAPRPPVDDRPASFEGRVVSAATGIGIAGADLTFSRAGAAASTRAGPDGAFTFVPPVTGRWLLAAVSAAGFLPFAPEWGHSPVQLEARAGQHVRGLEIHLAPAVELTGEVVDPEGRPVAGAEVRLLGTASEAALLPVADRFVSGPDGRFTFAAPEGTVLEATRPGFLPGRAELGPLERVNRKVVIELGGRHVAPLPAAAISGEVVLGPEGRPAEGALVSATRMGPRSVGDAPSAQSVTGADGLFTLRDLTPGRYRVAAHADGRAPASLRGILAGAEALRLELTAGSSLRGCVRDASSGAPVAPFTVMVFERRSALGRVAQRSLSVVEPGGCYALDDLTPGPAAVVFSAPGYAPSEETRVDLPAAGGEAVVDGRLVAGGRLTGRVIDDATGAPLAGAVLSVEGMLASAASTFPVLAGGESDAEGRFALAGLPRRFSLQVAAAGHHARIVGGLEAGPGEVTGPIEVRLHAVEPGETPRIELAGVGLQLMADGDALAVTGLVAEGGAALAGLRMGDRILAVDGRPVSELGMVGAVDAIRGPEGTTVRLTVRRDGVTREVDVARRLIRG
jgi:hypothetical protein